VRIVPNPLGESFFFDESVDMLLLTVYERENDDDGMSPVALDTPPNDGLNPLGLYPDDDEETPIEEELYPEFNDDGIAASLCALRPPPPNLTSCSGAPPTR